MQKTQNEVRLIGYLGKDPIITTASNGDARAFLRMATNYYRKDSNGKVIRKTSWHNVVAWAKIAESIVNQFIKGSHVLVEGQLEYLDYTDRTGIKRSDVRVRVSQILNLDR